MMPTSRKANNHIICTYYLQDAISILISGATMSYKTATENAKKYST